MWNDFKNHTESLSDIGNKTGVIVAWGGKSCDTKWLFKITEEQCKDVLFMPRWCKCFMDPKQVMENCTTCELNKKHSEVNGHGLGEVWCHIEDKDNSDGAHSSTVDARAQADVIGDCRFVPFLDKPKSHVSLNEVWAKKRKNVAETREELKRKVPPGWQENEGETCTQTILLLYLLGNETAEKLDQTAAESSHGMA